jgi:segregation and condensation protein B
MNRRDLDNRQERAAALGDLEALLFAAARPLSLPEIARWLYLEEPQASELVGLLDQELSRPERGLQLREAGAKWQLETRADREDVVAGLRAERGARPLTEQALETLAVVALRQPVTTEEVTAIRGAESYGTIVTLRRQKLVARSEQRSADGRAARWRTTQHFLDQFGLANLEELYREGRIEKLFGSSLGAGQAPDFTP